jgi:hypothetical protein
MSNSSDSVRFYRDKGKGTKMGPRDRVNSCADPAALLCLSVLVVCLVIFLIMGVAQLWLTWWTQITR